MSPCVSMGISYIGNADVFHAALPHFIPQELRYFVHRRCNSLSPAKRGDCFADRGINNNMKLKCLLLFSAYMIQGSNQQSVATLPQ